MRARLHAIATCLATAAALPAAADESGIALVDDPGRAQVQSACSMCHSLDYIVMNSPFQDQAAWEKTIRKMVTVYGAPLTDDESVAIAGYLARHYGK